MPELENLTLLELKKLAKENNIRNISKLNKEELIEVLKSIQNNDFEVNEDDEDFEEENDYIEENESKTSNYDIDNDESESLEDQTITYQVNNEEDEIIEGMLEVLPEGYGFLRGNNYLSSPKDVYISPVQIKRFRLDKGDKIKGIARNPKKEKNSLH